MWQPIRVTLRIELLDTSETATSAPAVLRKLWLIWTMRLSFGALCARASGKGAVQVPGLGIKINDMPDLQTKMQADFRDLISSGTDV